MNYTYFNNPRVIIGADQVLFVIVAYVLILFCGVSLSPLAVSLEPMRKLHQTFNFSMANVAIGVLFGLLLYYLAFGYVHAFNHLMPGSTWTNSAPVHGFMHALLGNGAAPGFSEELLFRGVLPQLIGPWLSNLLFAALHVTRETIFTTGSLTFFLGLAMYGLYSYTGSLVAPMVAHAVYNVIIDLAKHKILFALPSGL